MLNNPISRYRPTYRADEIDLILRFAQRGESLGLVGLAGIGKSNIVNFLRNLKNNAPNTESRAAQLLFPVVDATQWQENNPESLWQIVLDALKTTVDNYHLDSSSISNDAPPFRAVQQLLQKICQELNYQVMFILDDFDQVLANGPLSLLEQLNVLRNEGNRGKLSYLVFTKRLPHILGRNLPLEDKSKFYDLFRYNIFALEPYTQEDAMRMLEHLNQMGGNRLDSHQLEQIHQLAGGHARLLKLVFEVWLEQGASGIKANYFAERPEIVHECRRIFNNLHEHEQQTTRRVTRGRPEPEDQLVLDHLLRRGMLTQIEPATWFSPLMSRFLNDYEGEI
jgi:hypothetical protein